ncbi:MAG: divalent metal cation transporter [Solirubrobacteraceae bacterium]|nr:divalent metal cation transporter [Solirubrobacteraceae bacterium]
MKKLLSLALGIIAAIGGFVDIGDLVFTIQAGATFGYQLLWAVPIGVVGIVIFAEMSGRIAAVAGKPNMDLVHDQFSPRLGKATLWASLVLSFLTLAAELGGVGLVLNLFFDVSDQFFMFAGTVVLVAVAYLLPFGAIERIFGYGGLCLLVFAVLAFDHAPNWQAIGNGFVPDLQSSSEYWYFAVGLMAAALMPYEIYFYSSGAVEEEWDESNLGENRFNAIAGFGLGGFVALALIIAAAEVLQPAGVDPSSIGTTLLTAQIPYGETGLFLAGLGILFAVGGASIDTCFSAAYNLAQYKGWTWGKHRGAKEAPRWTVTWILLFLGGYAVVATGVDPVQLTEYSVVLSVLVLPLTYYPILRASNDSELMGEHVSGAVLQGVGWLYFVLICVLAFAAPVLLLATNGGGG